MHVTPGNEITMFFEFHSVVEAFCLHPEYESHGIVKNQLYDSILRENFTISGTRARDIHVWARTCLVNVICVCMHDEVWGRDCINKIKS